MLLLIFRKYRLPCAVILLGLYCYIAMPVQVWHQHVHTVTAGNAVIFTSKTPVTVVIDAGRNYSKECKVCAHQYPGYYADQQQIQIDTLGLFLFLHAVFTPSLSELSSFGLLNKGPPSTCIPV